jgi:hypothetical protein
MRLPLFLKRCSLPVLLFAIAPLCAQCQNSPAAKDSTNIISHTIKGVLSVYPDVATGNLNVRWENQAKCTARAVITDTADKDIIVTTFSITAASGQTMLQSTFLKPGQYTITIDTGQTHFVGKLTVLP